MSRTRFECRQVIKKNWTKMTPGSETLTYPLCFIKKNLFDQVEWEKN